jgi:hypothetical protein
MWVIMLFCTAWCHSYSFVGHHHGHAAAGRLADVFGGFGELGQVSGRHGHLDPLRRQRVGAGAPQPLAGAADDGLLAGDSQIH